MLLSHHNKDISIPPSVAIPMKPTLELGISKYNINENESIKKMLLERFNGKCDVCGISLERGMEYHHYHGNTDVWYNSCSMCYFSENLDKINHFDKGSIIYFPDVSQARLNSIIRGVWSVYFLDGMTDDDDDYYELKNSFKELGALINNRVHLKCLFEFSEPDIVSSFFNLIPQEEYEQRHKLFRSFRWLPDLEMYKDDMVYWTQNDFIKLHPEKINSNITKFMSKYTPDFKVIDR